MSVNIAQIVRLVCQLADLFYWLLFARRLLLVYPDIKSWCSYTNSVKIGRAGNIVYKSGVEMIP